MKKRLLASLVMALILALVLVASAVVPATASVAEMVPANVTVGVVMSMTITDTLWPAGIYFGSVAPGSVAPDLDQTDVIPSLTISIGSETNVDVDLEGWYSAFWGPGTPDSSWLSPSWALTSNPPMTQSYSTITHGTMVSNMQAGDSQPVWNWLYVASGVLAGDYHGGIYYAIVRH